MRNFYPTVFAIVALLGAGIIAALLSHTPARRYALIGYNVFVAGLLVLYGWAIHIRWYVIAIVVGLFLAVSLLWDRKRLRPGT